jgi:hypothetical protein
MLSSVFIPNRYNSYAWVNVIGLILLLCLGKIEPYTVIFGYFIETIIIGVFNIIKMIITSNHDGSGKTIVFFVLFFMFHYGMFVAVQSVFAFLIIGISSNSFINEPFDILDNYASILTLEGMEYILPMLIGTQFLKLIFDFILPKKYLIFTVIEIMYKPYIRIFIQQFTVIIAMFFIVFSNNGIIAAILLIFFRAIVDFILVGIRDNEILLNKIVNKLYDGKTSKEKLRKQLLLFSE